jgi:hypothetical protein
MSQGQGISREQSIGELVSMTFGLYRRNFVAYLVLFLVVEAISGALTTLVQHVYTLPVLPANATPQQFANWVPGFLGALIPLLALSALVAWVFFPVAVGSTIRMASDDITKGHADLEESVRFSVSKLVWMWVLGILVGVIVLLGFIALVVPGIILSIMFCLVLPVLLIENTGVIESLGRSRKLVAGRWLKTIGVFIVFAIIVGIASAIASAIAGPFGYASNFVSSVLSALYIPLVPIALTVYYYSNAARTAPVQTAQAAGTPAMAPAAVVQAGTKFCPSCGAKLASLDTFCFKCGAQQPA